MKFLIAFAIASLLMVFIQIINALRRKPRTTEEKVSEFGTTATPAPAAEAQQQSEREEQPRPICGLGGMCNLDCRVEDLKEEPDYYEDEELDAFRGRPSDAYSPEEVEQFEEVLTTMRPEEVHGWLRSLGLRGVELPNELKDEAFMIVREQSQPS